MGRALPVALVAVLALGVGCGGDDDDAADGTTSTTTSSASPGDGSAGTGDTSGDADDATPSTGADTGAAGPAVGTFTLDGESHQLDTITGILSCQFDDPEGDFSVSAGSEDGRNFLILSTFGDDPDSNEFSVTVDETEYVSASPADVQYDTAGQVVSGTIGVVPLFEEGTAQDVSFEVDCS